MCVVYDVCLLFACVYVYACAAACVGLCVCNITTTVNVQAHTKSGMC